MSSSTLLLLACVRACVPVAIGTSILIARLGGWHRARTFPPRSPVAGAKPDTRVRIDGTVAALGALIRSPITGQPCVAYRVTLTRPSKSRDVNRQSIAIVVDEVRANLFTVTDATGTATVDASSRDLTITTGPWRRSSAPFERAAADGDFVSRHVSALAAAASAPIHGVEEVLLPGDVVRLYGAGVRPDAAMLRMIRSAGNRVAVYVRAPTSQA